MKGDNEKERKSLFDSPPQQTSINCLGEGHKLNNKNNNNSCFNNNNKGDNNVNGNNCNKNTYYSLANT